MKTNRILIAGAGLAAAAVALVSGCSTPTIPVTMNVAGEVKLNGISKIALADFNSLKGDAFAGEIAADAETCALVKRAVQAAFYSSPMYQISDLDAETEISAEAGSRPAKRYDAVICGRVWWQTTGETKGQYPKVYSLESWDLVPYQDKNLTGQIVQQVAHVTTQKKDVLKMLDYRTQGATLMLTLSVYRLGNGGDVVKVVDTYQVTDAGFTLMNGEMKADVASVGTKDDGAVARLKATGKGDEKTATAYDEMFGEKTISLADAGKEIAGALTAGFASIGKTVAEAAGEKKPEAPKAGPKRDANGKIVLTQETVAMPTELQAKLMLANSVASGLAAKLAPSKVTFDIPADLGDAKLENLLRNGAFKSAKDYAIWTVRQKLGKEVCAKLVKFLPDFGENADYAIPPSTVALPAYNERVFDALLANEFNLSDIYFYTLGTSHEVAAALEGSAQFTDKLVEYLTAQKFDTYFYAMGICAEAAQDYDGAMECYRFAFNARPNMDAAQGIARVYEAIGQNAKLKETGKAAKKAAKKASLD